MASTWSNLSMDDLSLHGTNGPPTMRQRRDLSPALCRCVLLLALLQVSFAHGQELDSLRKAMNDPTLHDTLRADAMAGMVRTSLMAGQPDSALAIAYQLERFCSAQNVTRRTGSASAMLGTIYAQSAAYDPARVWFRKAMAHHAANGDKKQLGETELSLGLTYHLQGLRPQALQHDLNALATIESIGDSASLARAHNNIAALYTDMEQFDNALIHLNRALSIMRPRNDPRLRNTIGQLGILYRRQGDYDKAMPLLLESVERSEALQDNETLSRILQTIADIHFEKGDAQLSMDTYTRSSILGSPYTQIQNLINIGKCLVELGRERDALNSFIQAIAMAKANDDLVEQSIAQHELFVIYEKQGNKALALEAFKQHVALRDSISNTDKTRELTQIEMQFGFDKQQLADSLLFAQDKAIQVKEIQKQKVIRNGFVGGFALVALFAVVFFTQRNRISKEKARSEELLLNILPSEVAEELKAKGAADAVQIDQVTVLFTDFKGFTALSEKLSPRELVKDLNECFSGFDRITGKYGIEKIKTIGDAYMAAGGLPTPNTTHATDVVQAALEMCDFVAEGKARKIAAGLPFFEVRIGIHTGPVVAGIVGVKKFQYDIWGDTVNTASRMESSGEVGQVNISETTYDQVKVHQHFTFTPRGKVQAKGKGEMEMFFVSRNAVA